MPVKSVKPGQSGSSLLSHGSTKLPRETLQARLTQLVHSSACFHCKTTSFALLLGDSWSSLTLRIVVHSNLDTASSPCQTCRRCDVQCRIEATTAEGAAISESPVSDSIT